MGAPIKDRVPVKETYSGGVGPNLGNFVGWRERLNALTKEMTYREIAERAVMPDGKKLSFTTIRSLIQGTGGVQIETLLAICDGLQIDASKIISGRPMVPALPPPGVAVRSHDAVVPLPVCNLDRASDWRRLAASPETIDSVYFAGDGDRNFIALRVIDESMTPDFALGDIVLADPKGKPKEDDFVVLSVGNGPAMLRGWKQAKDGKVTLTALNEDYGVLRQPLDRLTVHGVARRVAHSL